ncbi:AAA family ATPase [Providencia rettgeri]|uniref:AAA family ATPase n=1 Tax=Proteus mirabilis TaxID=584 RepID=UPI001A240257|nr:AAA family ATPase [Providencia rettgeri]HAT2164888.1 AAA family ATPase [Proteus mirabilis]
MNIQKLEIKGFKSIAHVSLVNISPFLVFAGANGAGKSNLVDALVFLGAVVQRGALQAIREFGGFSQIHCFKFRKEQRTTMSFALSIDIAGQLFDYSLKIRELDKAPELQESLKINQASIIDRKAVGETLISLTEGAPLQKLPDYPKEMSALMLLGKNPLYGFLTNIRVFRIDPFAAKEPDTSTADASILDAQGKNIATMLSVLEKDEDFREQIIEWIELIVPGMEAVATEKQRLDSSTVITFKEEGTRARFPAKLISDGTIYALCILTAILSRSKSSGITIIEEPERGIHPKAISELVSLMRDNASTEHPVFITTHSESVVRNLETNELYFASKVDGKTQLQGALDSGVDKTKIPLDTAWLTNLFDGGLPW